ncbi:MAG: cell wall biosynthesis glycosyltransferase, partial [Candidatus Subteraquimicrobiales bacterium]|nr:cell wall biosynthesis glycosyltransferase [Candidatus Subteraquimicrobiales bacterium]
MPTVLPEEVIAKVNEIQEADIIVGIPSFRTAKTISHVVRVAGEGIVKFFSGLKGVVVNTDGGSEDKTMEIALATPVPRGVKKIVTPYLGLPGKGSAFHAIFEIADRLGAQICVVVDSDLLSITPEWIRLLGEPVLKHNYGFVLPYYLRHKHDGTITNAIAYPLTRALYGRKVRQPIGGDFGFSGRLAKLYSHENVWETDIARFGIDIWMTTLALNEGIRVCQVAMGVKLHDAKDPSTHLKPMFEQVVGTTFSLMKRYEIRWKALKVSEPVKFFGKMRKAEELSSIEVDSAKMISQFKKGFEENKFFWAS